MKKFVKIVNGNEIPLHGIRLLGQSLKDSAKIGQFGTGLKEAIALCLRKGLEFVIFSGETRIDFEQQLIDGQEEVCFKIDSSIKKLSGCYAPQIWHGMGFSPRLGLKDWTSEWQILREVICNAVDEGEYSCGFSDSLVGTVGMTAVYISNSEKLATEMGDVMVWKIREDRSEVFIEKPEPSPCRIFCKGVFIHEFKLNSLYDFNFNTLKVTESRTCSINDAGCEFVKALYSQQCPPEVVRKYIKEIQALPNFETGISFAFYYASFSKTWADIWIQVWGPRSFPTSDAMVQQMLQKRGYLGISVKDAAIRSGIETMIGRNQDTVLSDLDRKGIDIVPKAPMIQKSFEKIWARFEELDLVRGKMIPGLKIFKAIGTDNDILGEYKPAVGDQGPIVLINDSIVRSHKMTTVMVEEIGHHLSGATDHSANFQNWLMDALTTAGGFGAL